MEDKNGTIEQMWQKGGEARKAAKALQQKLKTITDPDDRKQLLRQINELFTQASALRNEAKHRLRLDESIGREFNILQANLEGD